MAGVLELEAALGGVEHDSQLCSGDLLQRCAFSVECLVLRVQGYWFGVSRSGFRILGFGSRVKNSAFGAQGFVFRVE